MPLASIGIGAEYAQGVLLKHFAQRGDRQP
jgi:hypothetical protein